MFESSRECKLIQVYIQGDLEKFILAMNEYDQVSRLKKIESILLLEMKRRLTVDNEPDFS